MYAYESKKTSLSHKHCDLMIYIKNVTWIDLLNFTFVDKKELI